jgi:hypothetical protein
MSMVAQRIKQLLVLGLLLASVVGGAGVATALEDV